MPPAIACIVLLPHLYLNFAHPTGSPSNPPVSLDSLNAILTANAGPILFGMVALLAMGGSIWAWRFRERRAIVALGLGWVLIPLVLFVFARAAIGMPTLSPRYDVFAIPGACVLAACGLAAVHTYWRPGAIIATLIIVAVAIPMQISVRTKGAHDQAAHRLAVLLGQPGLADLPIVAASGGIRDTVDAARYPLRIITPPSASPSPVVVIVAASADSIAHGSSPYLQSGGPWRPVVRCAPGANALLAVLAVPGAILPAGDPESLARQLNAAMPRARCVATP